MFLANFLIALREGLEAALVVGILVAYLVKTERRDLLPRLWVGVLLAAAIPLAAGAYMTWGPTTMTFKAQETLGGVLSLVAVGMITWMILWMGKNAASQKSDLESSMAGALDRDSRGRGVVWIGVLAVGREALETALFVWATTRSTMNHGVVTPVAGVVTGLVVALLLGYGIFAGAVRIDLGKFFRWSGALLVIVAAGIVAYGLGDLQEAGVLPGAGHSVWDLSHLVPTSGVGAVVYTVFQAILNLNPTPTWLQVTGWALYLAVVLPLFLRATRRRPRLARPASAPSGTDPSTHPDPVDPTPTDK